MIMLFRMPGKDGFGWCEYNVENSCNRTFARSMG